MAIAALILGILGFCVPLVGIAGLVLGIVAINQIDRSRGVLGGRGMAMAGAIIGGIGMMVSVVFLMAGILLPALGSARKTARQMQNSTQVRGLHQAMVTAAQANKFWFPGTSPQGLINEEGAISNRHGSLMRLQEDDFFEAEYNLSPGEVDPNVQSLGINATQASDRGSFAVLEYATGEVGSEPTLLGKLEWKDNLNTSAVVLGDRELDTKGSMVPRSVWSVNDDVWHGTVCFGDNHVQFELSDGPFSGKYGGSRDPQRGTIGMLFDTNGSDGRMVQD